MFHHFYRGTTLRNGIIIPHIIPLQTNGSLLMMVTQTRETTKGPNEKSHHTRVVQGETRLCRLCRRKSCSEVEAYHCDAFRIEIGKTLLEGRAESNRTAVTEGGREVGDKKQRGYLGFRRNCKRRVKGKANPRSSRGEDVESM